MLAFKLAQREFKNNFRYWFFFSLNLTIGLVGFTFIFLFRENVSQSLAMRSTQLLSSDIAISGRRDISGEEEKKVMDFMKPLQTEYSRLVSLYSMGKSDSKTRLLFVKFIQDNYPLIGEIKVSSHGVVESNHIQELNRAPLVWISPEVEHQFKLSQGDRLKIGSVEFKVDGVIEADTTSAMRGFQLAPKVYVGQSFLEKTELVSYGTVAWRTRFFNLKDSNQAENIKKQLNNIITDKAIKVRTPENASEQLSRVIGYLSDFLGLIGVVALLMSAVGISYLYQSYIFERLKQVGILKSIGVSRSQILLNFLIIIFCVGILSTIMTLGVANIALPFATDYLKEFFKGDFLQGVTWEVVGAIFSLSLIVNILTCFPVLSLLLRQKTTTLLNGELEGSLSPWLYLPGAFFLWGMSIWQAHSLIIGSVFFLALFVVFLIVMTILPLGLSRLNKKLLGVPVSRPVSLPFGYSLRLIARNKFTTLLMVLSLSIGVTLISVIGQLDKSLKTELTSSKEPKPSLFLFDIQEEQVADLKAFAEKNQIPLREPTPMIRARLLKKNGEVVKREEKKEGFSTREEDQSRRFNNRGVNLSYAPGLNASEKLVEGRDFSGTYNGEGMAEVSLEKRYAKRLGVEVGDTLTYEVLGVEVQAKIVNLRQVNWTSFLPNFFIVFQPGVLENAPKTFLAVVRQISFETQLKIQDLFVENFSNISIINVSEVIEKVLSMFKVMAWAIGVMSLCCIVVGLFVLYSILQSQLLKKQKEMALQKLMGFEASDILKITIYEFSFLSFVAQFIGSVMGIIVAYIVSFLFLDGVFVFNGEFLIGVNIVLYLLTVMTIFFTFKLRYSQNVNQLLSD